MMEMKSNLSKKRKYFSLLIGILYHAISVKGTKCPSNVAYLLETKDLMVLLYTIY